MGQPGVFYLPQYIALILSNFIWGQPFAAIDLMAIMHGLLAVAGTYFMLRHLGTTSTAAAFGALTGFSAFFVWVGQSWVTATILCAWFSWMIWAALRYVAKPSTGRAALVMFFRLGLLYAGHSQFFVLAFLFEHLFALTYTLVEKLPHRLLRCTKYAALSLPTALLGLPFLLLVNTEMGRSLLRSEALSYGQFSSIRLWPPLGLLGNCWCSFQYPYRNTRSKDLSLSFRTMAIFRHCCRSVRYRSGEEGPSVAR